MSVREKTLLSDCIGNFPLQRIPSSSQPLSCVQSEKTFSSLLWSTWLEKSTNSDEVDLGFTVKINNIIRDGIVIVDDKIFDVFY